MIAWTDSNCDFDYIVLLYLRELEKEIPTS